MIYLVVITLQLASNNITITNAIILVVLYVIHIFMMKFNSSYEVAIKKNVARSMEIKELTNMANTQIDVFHRNLNSRSLTIEALKKLDYKVDDKYIVFEDNQRKRIKDPCVVIVDEEIPFSMMDDRGFIARMLWKKATIKVIIRIQAYKFFEKVKRNFKSKVDIYRILPYLADEKGDNSMAGLESQRHLEGEMPAYPRNDEGFKKGGGGKKFNSLMVKTKANRSHNVSVGAGGKNVSQEDQDAEGEEEDDASASSSRVSGTTSTGGGTVYDIINRAVNKDKYSLAWPKGWKARVQYVFMIPLTHT